MDTETKALPSISVVVPVYNSELTLPMLIERLEPVLVSAGRKFEAVLVDDGSRDQSWAVIAQLAALHPWVRGLNLMRNFGQHNAILCGIRAAQFEIIVTLDDDLQHPPEEIPKLLAKLAEGFDVVYGTPESEQHGFWRDAASRVTKLSLQTTMGAEIAGSVSAFRVFRTDLRKAFTQFHGPFVLVDVLLTWATQKFSAIKVRHDPRRAGVSNYTFTKLLVHAINMMTGFSVLPLQLASLTGFAFTVFGIAVLVFVVVRYFLSGSPVPGFAFLASVIAIFSGAQLFSLGIIGEYLARMHFRLMEKPSYTIRSITSENGQ